MDTPRPLSVVKTMNRPGMIVFDLDKTLLNEHEQVTPRTQDMLDCLTEAGIIWTVATGRAAGKLQFPGLTERARTPWVCTTG
ncbi:MAG: HAD family hydrolase, partial [Pseudonocardiaceae bacterium]